MIIDNNMIALLMKFLPCPTMTIMTPLDIGNEGPQETSGVQLIASDSESSTVTNINLYSGHAEITRLFQSTIKSG